jgi:hypothetical protein
MRAAPTVYPAGALLRIARQLHTAARRAIACSGGARTHEVADLLLGISAVNRFCSAPDRRGYR